MTTKAILLEQQLDEIKRVERLVDQLQAVVRDESLPLFDRATASDEMETLGYWLDDLRSGATDHCPAVCVDTCACLWETE